MAVPPEPTASKGVSVCGPAVARDLREKGADAPTAPFPPPASVPSPSPGALSIGSAEGAGPAAGSGVEPAPNPAASDPTDEPARPLRAPTAGSTRPDPVEHWAGSAGETRR